MKKLFIIIALLAVLLAVKAAESENYGGSWTLDLKQSKNLPTYYSNVKSHRLVITQNEKYLQVAVEIDAGGGEPDKINFVYNLNGSESQTETAIRTPKGIVNVPTTLKAIIAENGKLQITITREITMPDKTFKGITVEDWELNADGKILTIHRTDDTPRGKIECEMVFIKN